jgi:hypothetical protein
MKELKLKIKDATEQQLRDMDVPWPKSIDELVDYIKELSEKGHDYGTAVYAMSMASVATYYYMSHVVGASGFQASCADLDFIKRTRGFRKLLYPQHLSDDDFPTIEKLLIENGGALKVEAKRLLAEHKTAHPSVIEHWERLASFNTLEEK